MTAEEDHTPAVVTREKPLPDLGQLLAGAGSRGLGQLLPWNGPPRTSVVPYHECNWWRTRPPTALKRVIFTLMQPANQDSDLYILRNPPYTSSPLLGCSERMASSTGDDYTPHGIPDWVCVVLGPTTTGTPQVLVRGQDDPAGDNTFSIEVDVAQSLTVNVNHISMSASYGDSRWFRFRAVAAAPHTVAVTVPFPSEVPSFCVYDSDSSGFVGTHTGGAGSVAFSALANHWYYVRVWGETQYNKDLFDVAVTSP